ncbi:RIP metalloprotease RseP [Cytobacillus sp. IB215665]|uniref:RIP metalloprotease RseP n=1 Tax=Cytobacillus sp. IB215665 TaxID=3097357 RepID=UPI002A118E4E|nr:RIP metalloprotease RseP [Cytobacillus sp. IB215665]MDX8365099.1 RIP metalloprotease RseP [Cytobacillus sp. IB215665]
MDTLNTVIAFVIIFGALVFVHELGHLVFAKRAGILCREFAIGFGPKVFTFKKKETLYTIRLLPIGGFVRMAGEDPEMIEIKPGHSIGLLFDQQGKVTNIVLNNKDKYPDARIVEVEFSDLEHDLYITGYEEDNDEKLVRFEVSETAHFIQDEQHIQIAPYSRQFSSKTLWQRTLAIFAGPLMNFVLAAVLFMVIAFIQGYPSDDPQLGEVIEGGAAVESGLQEGDIVLAINNKQLSSWDEVVQMIQNNPEKQLLFTIERDGQSETIAVTPKLNEVQGVKIGQIGVYPSVNQSILGSIAFGAEETFVWTKEIIILLGKLITGQFSFDMLSGPVGIYKTTEEVAQSGVLYLMRWAALLSINLGIMNLLPLPALDGGRLMFFAIEAVRGKPIDRQKEGMVHFIGFALLMLLMLVVTWNDIQRFFL